MMMPSSRISLKGPSQSVRYVAYPRQIAKLAIKPNQTKQKENLNIPIPPNPTHHSRKIHRLITQLHPVPSPLPSFLQFTQTPHTIPLQALSCNHAQTLPTRRPRPRCPPHRDFINAGTGAGTTRVCVFETACCCCDGSDACSAPGVGREAHDGLRLGEGGAVLGVGGGGSGGGGGGMLGFGSDGVAG